MKTSVTEMLGIEFPILAFSHCRDVVAAVSKAGGLGVLGAVGHSDKDLEIDLKWIEEEVGDSPYGVDLIVPARYAGDGEGGLKIEDIAAMIPDEHRKFLEELLERYEVPEEAPEESKSSDSWSERSTDAPFSANRAARQIEIALAHKPSLMANALGPPPKEMIDKCHTQPPHLLKLEK